MILVFFVAGLLAVSAQSYQDQFVEVNIFFITKKSIFFKQQFFAEKFLLLTFFFTRIVFAIFCSCKILFCKNVFFLFAKKKEEIEVDTKNHLLFELRPSEGYVMRNAGELEFAPG